MNKKEKQTTREAIENLNKAVRNFKDVFGKQLHLSLLRLFKK